MRKKLIKDHHQALKTLAHIQPKNAQTVLANAPASFFNVIRTLAHLMLDGSIPLEKKHKQKLMKHKHLIRKLAGSKGLKTQKIISQSGGSIFSTILKIVLPLIPSLLI